MTRCSSRQYAGYQGVELRVHGNCHVSLQELQRRCDEIKRQVEAHRLELCVYNTYFGVNEPGAIDAMIDICARTGVRYFRVTLPVAGVAAVRNLGTDRAVVPSYREGMPAAGDPAQRPPRRCSICPGAPSSQACACCWRFTGAR